MNRNVFVSVASSLSVAARAGVVALLLIGTPVMTLAQSSAMPSPSPTPPDSPGLLTHSEVVLAIMKLRSGDPRFVWDGRLKADFDVVDYGAGRMNLLVDYEGVFGDQRRPFDLNDENFTAEVSGSYRTHGVELTGVLHHVSRHLTDRENDSVVAWNTIGGRATRGVHAGKFIVEGAIEGGKIVQRTFVDYTWTSQLKINVRREFTPRTALFGETSGALVGVDPAIADRDRLCGARIEGGVRLTRSGGAVELFTSYERRIDAYPLSRQRSRWFEVGFRFSGGSKK